MWIVNRYRSVWAIVGLLSLTWNGAAAQNAVRELPFDQRTVNAPTTVAADEVVAEIPQFIVDPFWPKPLPNNWIVCQVSGVHVDSDDHVWIVQRPNSLSDREIAATQDPPASKCCFPVARAGV